MLEPKWMRLLTVLLVVIVGVPQLVQARAPLAAPAGAGAIVGYPQHQAALGDSITRGFNADGNYDHLGDQVQYSWSTGTDPQVLSHYTRILSATGQITATNVAVSGNKVANLQSQVAALSGQPVDYVTILIGANDVCTSSEAAMTPVSTFHDTFYTATLLLSTQHPDARIFVASIPNIYRLWEILHTDQSALFVWDFASICQSMLANPNSMDQADVDRRARVQQRIVDFNAQLAAVCAEFIHCRFDDYTVYNDDFTAADVSTLDYYHPSIQGQDRLAQATYTATFDFTEQVAPTSTAVLTATASGADVALSAVDNVAVSGIEYRVAPAVAWTRYTTPLSLPSATTLIYRAVDVNGNIEAEQTLNTSNQQVYTAYLPYVQR